jgi:hypothetical protein
MQLEALPVLELIITIAGGERGLKTPAELEALKAGCAGIAAWVRVANRNHRRPGSQSSDSRAQIHCTGSGGPDPQSLQLGA